MGLRGDSTFSTADLDKVLQEYSGAVILPTVAEMERDAFREAVFERDNHRCVVCDAPAQDAHHLIERKLWPDGGYHVDNGVSLCGIHHMQAEQTLLNVDTLRDLAGITKIVLPETLERGHEYDKWGNVILPDGTRMQGPLYHENSVQRLLEDAGLRDLYTPYVKFPRTPYLVWSPEIADEDLLTLDPDLEAWQPDDQVVITEKLDGENTTMYPGFIHARSIDSGYHESRTWVKNFHAKISQEIPQGYRICGENLYAKHSIKYENLESYFYGISMWHQEVCLPWADTLEWFELLGITPVPVLFRGSWKEAQKILPRIEVGIGEKMEGYVIRLASSFSLLYYHVAVGKYVRANHVQTSNHWRHGKIEKNELR